MAVLCGALALPNYEIRRAQYMACNWLPPRWDWVDPLKDIQAEIKAIKAGLKSRTQGVAERGYDIREVDKQLAEEKNREDFLGILQEQKKI